MAHQSSMYAKNTIPSGNRLYDANDEIHIPVAKFHTGDEQPGYSEIQEGMADLYEGLAPKTKDSESIAEDYWTVKLDQMAHCGIKKYGDVNNLDKKRLNLHERIIHALIVIPPGAVIKQYPLGGIFTFNPYFDVVCGYVFTAWQDVSYLSQPGITHIAVFKKLDSIPPMRAPLGCDYLTKKNVCDIIPVSTRNGIRNMRLYISDHSKMDENPEHGVILEDVEQRIAYYLDLVKLRKVPEPPTQSLGGLVADYIPSWDSVMSYVPQLTYLDEAWDSDN